MRIRLFILSLFLFALSFAAYHSNLFYTSAETLAKGFSHTFKVKQERLEKLVEDFSVEAREKTEVELFQEHHKPLEDLFRKDGLALLVFREGQMVFWSDNSAPVLNYLGVSALENSFIQIQNGWYSMVVKHQAEVTVVGLMQVKSIYPHQNQYLQNKFQENFNLPPEVEITLNSTFTRHHIFGHEGNFLFGLLFPQENYPLPHKNSLALLLFFIGIALLCYFFQANFNQYLQTSVAGFLVFSAIMIMLRALLLIYQFPPFLYRLALFSPEHYASSDFSPSLGDFLLNSIMVFYLLYVFNTKFSFKTFSLKNISHKKKSLIIFSWLLLLFLFAAQVVFWLSGLVLHSNINFNLNNIFELDFFGITGFFITVLLLFSFYLFADKLLSLVKILEINSTSLLKLSLLPFSAYILLLYITFHEINIVNMFWPLPVIFTIWWLRVRMRMNYSFFSVLVVVLAFSVFTSYNFSRLGSERELSNREILIQRLAQERDPIAEFMFKEIEQEISKDKKVNRFAGEYWNFMDLLDAHLRDNFFSGYWLRYDIQFTVCSPDGFIIIEEENRQENCYAFFDSIKANFGQGLSNSNFYFLNNYRGRISYLGIIPIEVEEGQRLLFIEADSKFLPEGAGYPELLMDAEEIMVSPEMLNYSFAKYKHGRLLAKTGQYPYSIFDSQYQENGSNLYHLEHGGFSHLIFHPDATSTIILSRPAEEFMDKLTSFSYLFAFFNLLFMLVLFLRLITEKGNQAFQFDFRARIQVILVGTVLASLLLFGVWTASYIKRQYSLKNKSHIAEKTHSVLIELEHKIGSAPELTDDMVEYLTRLLDKFSHVFFSDINLYTPGGNLLASSQREIFNRGLSGKKMEPVAFKEIAINRKTEFIQRETIGNLEYISAYVPLHNVDGELLAYLNLPYFAKQTELEKELASFLVALINIYVLLFILSVIIAILLSNIITGPLQLIRAKLRGVELGKPNELIEWKSKDEIGSLVQEYNRMIVALSESAERLAKSERESAWREMAKQVAHEIKNPLTPMKLSIQHLERAKKDNAPDFDKKLQRFTQTLIEQIDALANIANEFSNFAKMPLSKPEEIDLKNLVKNVASLFKGTEEAEISVKFINETPLIVKADKEHLLRVLNNLVKNALQSIPYDKTGLVTIKVVEKSGMVYTSVIDNGAGIPEEQQVKIFVPNFTTKTGGSGLGLAISKNIVEAAGGKIWFRSEPGEGSEFTFCLPLVTSKQK